MRTPLVIANSFGAIANLWGAFYQDSVMGVASSLAVFLICASGAYVIATSD